MDVLQSEIESLRLLAEHASVVFWISAPLERKLLYVSPAYEAIWGRPRGPLYDDSSSFLDAIHPADREKVREDLGRNAYEGPFGVEYRIVRPDGSVRWIWDRGFPIRDGSGEVYRVVGIAEDVTARRQVEDELRQVRRDLERRVAERTAALSDSNDFLNALLENVQTGVVACDADGYLTLFNRVTREMHGLPQEPIPPEQWAGRYSLFRPDGRTPLGRAEVPLYRALRGEQVRDTEMVIAAEGHEPKTVRVSGQAIYGADGVKLGAVVSMQDITEAKRAVEALRRSREGLELRVAERTAELARANAAMRASEEKFRLMADTIPQLAWMARPDGHVFWYNRRWLEYTGTTLQEMLERGWRSVMMPEVLPDVVERWERTLATGEPFDMVFPLRRADGQFRTFLTRGSPLRDPTGQILYWFGTNTDITEQKWAEDASRFLADASASLASIIDYRSTLQRIVALAVPRFGDWAAVDMVEPDGSLSRLAVAHVDPAKVELAEELHRRYPPDPDAEFGAAHVARTGRSELAADISDELLASVAQDERHLRILRELGLKSYMCVPMTARGRVLGVLTFVAAESQRCYTDADLTLAEQLAGRAAVAVENSRLYAQLREADRRKDEFLAMLAHELRNPLAPIRTGLELLAVSGVDGEVVEPMRHQVSHLVRLVDDLLDVSRIMRGRIELRRDAVELTAIVSRAVETVRPMVQAASQTLSVAAPERPLWLDADPVRLTQVIANLLNNASKYTDRGGSIELSARDEGGWLTIAVRDTGVGIDAELLPRVFELFTQASRSIDRSQGGLGIGLTVVRSLVEMHGGSVGVRSDGEGRGSEFTVRLPLLDPVEARAARQPQQSAAGPLNILVVDDNVAGADLLARLLRKSGGHEVRLAHDGPDALAAAAASPPDVVLLDIGLPRMDGYEVARRLRGNRTLDGALIVALTGYGAAEDRRRSLEAGCDEHLTKPPSLDSLQAVFRHPKLRGGRRPS